MPVRPVPVALPAGVITALALRAGARVYPPPGRAVSVAVAGVRRLALYSGTTVSVTDPTLAGNITRVGSPA